MRLPFRKEKKQPDAPVVNAWDTSEDPTSAPPAENQQVHNNAANHPNDTANGGISEKTEQPPTPQNDPSSPTGSKTATPDPNQMHTRGASIDIPPQEMTPPIKETSQQQPDEWHKPSKARLLLRFWQLIAAIGAFGFQVGATPVSIHTQRCTTPLFIRVFIYCNTHTYTINNSTLVKTCHFRRKDCFTMST